MGWGMVQEQCSARVCEEGGPALQPGPARKGGEGGEKLKKKEGEEGGGKPSSFLKPAYEAWSLVNWKEANLLIRALLRFREMLFKRV